MSVMGVSVCNRSSKKIIIGRFMSSKDEDGYAKVEVNLPMPFQNTDDDTVGLE